MLTTTFIAYFAMAALQLLHMSKADSFYSNLGQMQNLESFFIDPANPPHDYPSPKGRLERHGRRAFKLRKISGNHYHIVSASDSSYKLSVVEQNFELRKHSRGFLIDEVRPDVFAIKSVGSGKFACFDHGHKNWEVNRDKLLSWEEVKFTRALMHPPKDGDIVKVVSHHGWYLGGRHGVHIVRKHGDGLYSLAKPLLPVAGQPASNLWSAGFPVEGKDGNFMMHYNAICLKIWWSWWQPSVNYQGCRIGNKNFHVGSWEKFQIHHEGEGSFSIRNHDDAAILQSTPGHERYLSIKKGDLCCGVNTWEKHSMYVVGRI